MLRKINSLIHGRVDPSDSGTEAIPCFRCCSRSPPRHRDALVQRILYKILGHRRRYCCLFFCLPYLTYSTSPPHFFVAMASLNITRSASSGGGTLVDEPLHSPVHSPKAFPPSGPQVAANNIKPQVVPPSNLSRARTLVLCFDGTGDQFDADVGSSFIALFEIRTASSIRAAIFVP